MHGRCTWLAFAFPLWACAAHVSPQAPLPPLRPFQLLQASAAEAAVSADVTGRSGLALTIYQGGPARVLDERRITLPVGIVQVRFPDVSNQLDATSLELRYPDGGENAVVLQQGFDPGSLTPAKALAAYVGKTIQLRLPATDGQPARVVSGTLLSVQGGTVVRVGEQVYLQPPGEIILPDVPAGLTSTPTASWKLHVLHGGARRLQAAYLTGGISWQAEYVLDLDRADTSASIAAWASLANQTATTFPDATISVVAGSLGRPGPVPYAAPMAAARATAPDVGPPRPMDELHRYDLGRTTLAPDQTSQLALISAQLLDVRRRYRFESYPGATDASPRPAETRLDLRNTTGDPLPAGRVRVYDPDGQLVGQDQLADVPKQEAFHVTLGHAFDVVGQHTQAAERQLGAGVREADVTVTLRNHKDKAVTVDVVEHPNGDWQVTAQSLPGTHVSASELDFAVPVPAGGETKLTYTVQVHEPRAAS